MINLTKNDIVLRGNTTRNFGLRRGCYESWRNLFREVQLIYDKLLRGRNPRRIAAICDLISEASYDKIN